MQDKIKQFGYKPIFDYRKQEKDKVYIFIKNFILKTVLEDTGSL